MGVRARARSGGPAATGGQSSPRPGAGRAVRIGGQTVLPGTARIVRLELPGRSDSTDAIPVWVAAGARTGPRVTVAGAPRGFEVLAARVATGLRGIIDVAEVNGSVIVAPVLRPGGRFAAHGQPISDSAAWSFPGDPGGDRRAREAFAVFSELALPSSLLVLLTAPEPGRAAALTVRGDFEDPRVRRLGLHARAVVALHANPVAGSLAAAARERGVAVLELIASSESLDERSAAESLMAATRGVLAAVGAVAAPVFRAPTPRTLPTVTELTVVRAPVGGLLEQMAPAGQTVERGALLVRIVPPLGGRAVEVRAARDSVVIEAAIRTGVRTRAPLFLLGRVPAAATRRRKQAEIAALPGGPSATDGRGEGPHDRVHVGWVESVSLPGLGVRRLRAKIDTGARTSALHVTRMETVGTTDGPHRRPILEVTLPSGSWRGARLVAVRVLVRDYVQVKDTSGRSERRPVIETTLRLGSLERRIRVTLTNRGDMLFPMLIGRTALGPGVVVDPARRLLLPTEPRGGGRGGRPVKVNQKVNQKVNPKLNPELNPELEGPATAGRSSRKLQRKLTEYPDR